MYVRNALIHNSNITRIRVYTYAPRNIDANIKISDYRRNKIIVESQLATIRISFANGNSIVRSDEFSAMYVYSLSR